MIDLIVGAIHGASGNYLTRILDAFWSKPPAATPLGQDAGVEHSSPDRSRAHAGRTFQTFSIRFGLEDVLRATPEAVVHVLVEDKPSTAWHLASLVVESRLTGEWYASSKGEMAFEGSGGGLAVSKKVASICSEKRISVAGWVCPRSLSDGLSSGEVLWPTVKSQLVPIVSYAGSDYFAKYLASRFRELNP